MVQGSHTGAFQMGNVEKKKVVKLLLSSQQDSSNAYAVLGIEGT